ncbi:MAG: hypothetical protein ACLS9A_08555 [Clostridia bacterium]
MNYLELQIPTEFPMEYSKVLKNQKYYSNNSKFIRAMLRKASKGYCMYCGKKTIIEGEDISQIEHSVDKDGNINQINKECFLTNCKYNFASACPKCNMAYKKKIKKVTLSQPEFVCPTECAEMCSEYLRLREEYVTNNQIILQPQGYPLEGTKCNIIYDLITHCYMHSSTLEDEKLIHLCECHIQRFHLNTDRISTSVLKICEAIVLMYDCGVKEISDMMELLLSGEPSNYVGVLFIEWIKSNFLEKNKTIDELVEFCKFQLLISDTI